MIKEINSDQFETMVTRSKGPVVVDFYSTECPPCEALAPKLHFFDELYGSEITFYKIYRQGNRDLAAALGVKSSPTLLFYKDGQEIGSRLIGTIKKSSIKEQLINLYGVEDKASSGARKELSYDLAIIGAGPAGLTAAIYAAQAKLSTIVLDKGNSGGTVNITHLVKNFPGTGPEPVQGFMLMHHMTEQAKAANAEIMLAAEIMQADLVNKVLYIDDDKLIRAKAIIIATGSVPRSLGIPGEREFAGKGISYCATCDGSFYEGKSVYVIGGGNSAVEEAIYLTRFVNKLTVIHQFDEFQANRSSAEELLNNPKVSVLWSHEPRAFIGKDSFEKLEVEDLKTHERRILSEGDGVFVFVGYVPQTELVKDQLAKDPQGYIISSEDMETSLPGVFVAGDVRKKRFRQITTSVSDGTIAALVAEKYIKAL